jgi:hypothetical protein
MTDNANPSDLVSLDRRLQEIDARLAQLPFGQIFLEAKRGKRRIYRVRREGAQTIREFLGDEGCDAHREAVALFDERRFLSAERKDLWRTRETLLQPKKVNDP